MDLPSTLDNSFISREMSLRACVGFVSSPIPASTIPTFTILFAYAYVHGFPAIVFLLSFYPPLIGQYDVVQGEPVLVPTLSSMGSRHFVTRICRFCNKSQGGLDFFYVSQRSSVVILAHLFVSRKSNGWICTKMSP